MNLVRVTIRNLTQDDTVQEKSDYSDESSRRHDIDASKLMNTVACRLSLYDCNQSPEGNHANADDDDIISHTLSCYLSMNDYEGNGYLTPKHSPHNHFKFDYVVPYKTSQ